MSRREMTWLEAATFTLENTSKIWMTAPELVREIEAKGYRSLRSKYNQAVRTLRATLNVQSRKEDGMFLRVEENFHVQFALKKRLNKQSENDIGEAAISKPVKPRQIHSERRTSVKEKGTSIKERTKQNTKIQKPLTNGILSPTPPSPHTPHLPLSPKDILTPSQPLMIEIDPTAKPVRNSNSSKDSPGGFCLPSPLHSLLGPMRTLHVLSESAAPPTSTRPVRQVRKKKHFDQENDAPNGNLSNGVPETVNPPPLSSSLSKLPEILRLEVCHQLPSFLSDVTCVRYESSSNKETDKSVSGGLDDPCLVQGDRVSTGHLEIDPDYVGTRSETEDDDDDDDDDLDSYESGSVSNYDSESELSDAMHIQPTPTNQLFVRKPMRRYTGTYSDISCEPLARETTSDSEASATMETTKRLSVSSSVAAPQKYSQRERTNSRSETTQKYQTSLRTSSTSNSDLNRIQPRVDQRRSISSLFAPSSPLVNENMKSLLNVDAFKGLTVGQKKRLTNHLPSVDRENGSSVLEESLTNSFLSSALREWQERVALGVHTPEYKARLRGEEKRRASLRPDDPWKHMHFEQCWGEKSPDKSESVHSTPYYPHFPSSPPHHKQILTTIIDGYCRKVPESETPGPPHTSSSSPPPTLTSSQSNTTADETRKPVEPAPTTPTKLNLKLQRKGAKPPPKSKSSNTSQKNHVVKKISQAKESKKLLPSLLTIKSQKLPNKTVNKKPVLKRLGTNSHTPPKTVVPKVQLNKQRGGSLPGEFLTRLPPKTPYQALLNMLIHMSKTITPPTTVKSPTYLPPLVEHNHAVFHDHFALLSSEHVPTEFSLPVKSLPIQLPLEVYRSCLKQKAIHSDHCYARMSGESPPKIDNRSLKLSLPRSLMRTSDGCACGGQPLVLCSECRSLYHSVCSQSTLCQTCSTLASLNLS